MFVLATSRPALRRARLFDHGFERFVGAAVPAPASSRPALDVVETDGEYTVTVDLPGITKDALQISVDGRRVLIEADVTKPAAAQAATEQVATEQVATGSAAAVDAVAAAEAKPDATPPVAAAPRVLYSERRATRLARSIVLPAEADDSRASAKLVDGVLTLVLPKKAQPQPSRIAVN